MDRGQILIAVFSLPCELLAPDVIVGELREPDGRQLVEMGLRSRELPGKQVMEVSRMAQLYRGPGRVDLFALALAKAESAVLLTGDRPLREAAENEGVVVQSTLWVLDQMYSLGLAQPPVLARSLKAMVEEGRRLPRNECERRIKKWSQLSKRRFGR